MTLERIRMKTVLIVERDGEYLSRKMLLTGTVMWSNSKWEAWKTRDRDLAEAMAARYGGRLMLFNPIIGRIKEYKKDSEKGETK